MCATPSHIPPHPPSKEAVLDAAQRLLNQRGYSGLSMRELAKHSGLAKATIYHHFQDKREIFLSVIEREFALVHQTLVAAAATPGDWRVRLHAMVTAYFALSSERGVAVITALREAGDFEEQLCSIIRRQRETVLEPVRAVLQEGVALGEVRALDLEMSVMSLFGMLHLFAAHQLLVANLYPDADLTDHILDVFLHGIVQPPSGSLPTHDPRAPESS